MKHLRVLLLIPMSNTFLGILLLHLESASVAATTPDVFRSSSYHHHPADRWRKRRNVAVFFTLTQRGGGGGGGSKKNERNRNKATTTVAKNATKVAPLRRGSVAAWARDASRWIDVSLGIWTLASCFGLHRLEAFTAGASLLLLFLLLQLHAGTMSTVGFIPTFGPVVATYIAFGVYAVFWSSFPRVTLERYLWAPVAISTVLSYLFPEVMADDVGLDVQEDGKDKLFWLVMNGKLLLAVLLFYSVQFSLTISFPLIAFSLGFALITWDISYRREVASVPLRTLISPWGQ